MAEAKIRFAKDWYNHVKEYAPAKRRALELEKVDVTVIEQLPELVSVKDAAKKLNINEKTIFDWMAKGHLPSIRIRGRRYTTATWIAEFIKSEIEEHG